ncbi:MAG: alpha-glucan family phosphorylase [Bacteroidia bacterium]|nr:alpha-glucan family phosphorylase [Bacteroidia bacterium]
MTILSNLFPYKFDKKYTKPVAYFSMEFAVDQPLKIYSGGLGFLAGSHMRSAFELKQNLIGIGILWKYGYYDQERNKDGTLRANYVQKDYSFLTDTGIVFPITIHNHTVHVKAFLLKPDVFNTVPMFLLSTDIGENDYLAQSICHRLYDSHESARIAQSILLGVGGAKLLDVLERKTEIYHMNEGHALPLCFYLLNKYKDLEEVKKRVVFTTHTPEKAGNEEHSIKTLEVLGFLQGSDRETVLKLSAPDEHNLSYTLAALRMSNKANGVSYLHGVVSRKMWEGYDGICDITEITNAQNKTYWLDTQLDTFLKAGDDKGLALRKKQMKRELFKVVANQTGKIFDENVITIVWARRFAGYKRANLLLRDFDRFKKLVSNEKYPVQLIWAGKPYPEDYGSVDMFNDIMFKTKEFANCAVVTGYEMELSGLLKKGSDVWLNNPRMYREASGTSGMTAAMNGSINVSIPDGWVPEFSKHGENCFVITPAEDESNVEMEDDTDNNNLLTLLEKEVLPMYYDKPKAWMKVMKQSMKDIIPMFDSNRMAREYYEKMYMADASESKRKKSKKELVVI